MLSFSYYKNQNLCAPVAPVFEAARQLQISEVYINIDLYDE